MAVPPRPLSGSTIGTDWGQAVHDTIVTQDLQSGLVNVTLSNAANASAPVNFPHPFAGAPIVVVALASAPGGTNKLIPRTTTQGPTGVTVYVYTADGSPATATVLVHWIAVGPRQ